MRTALTAHLLVELQMDRPMPTELDRAQLVLRWAYDRARAGGYAPGSQQMQTLAQAERTYQQAKRRHRQPRPHPAGPLHVIDLTASAGVGAGG